MIYKSFIGTICTCLAVISFNSHAAFVERLGGLAYYDDVLNLTWLTDANAAGTKLNWVNANNWAANLDVSGVTGWRLPNMDINGDDVIVSCTTDQAACKDNEYGHLYNYGASMTFGGGITSGSPDPFSNVLFDFYWSSTEYARPIGAQLMHFGVGIQDPGRREDTFFAWAVKSGDVSAIPVPAAVWLFGSGLISLVGLARRKKS